MIIKKMAVGNKDEAFVENDFNEGVNIISSDDNNKGKTIVIQSMMYALGNDPTLPTSFDYKSYYHYIEFEENGIYYYLCRYNNSFILKHNSILMIFDSVSELKRYWTKHIFRLPQIIKNQLAKIVDPVLFLQLFFVGQDKKDTSNISHAGLYNKQDYFNMIYDFCNASGMELDEEEIRKIKENIKNLKEEKDIVLKQHRILTSQRTPISYLSSTNDRAAFGKKLSEMEKVKSKITELRKARNAAATRKAKWETTLKELRSLNRTIDCGQLRCMDCDSTNISFSSSKQGGYAFDVSSVEMRNEIITSINEKIAAYNEEIEKFAVQISEEQENLQTLMEDESISLESIVAYKQEIFNAADAENKIKEIDQELSDLNTQLLASSKITQSKKDKQTTIINMLIEKMNNVYHEIDPTGNLYFDDLFTKRDEIYSGSEATIFHLVKLYALREILKHNYPIVVDSFRAEDLSTNKEEVVIQLYRNIQNQVIFTTTLKTEEMGKYDKMKNIKHIDYKNHTPSKMLSLNYLQTFFKLLANLSIQI